MLVQSKVTTHKSNLKDALGFNLGWCKVLKMPFQLFVTLCNISGWISKCFSNSISSLHWGSQVSYCEHTTSKQSQNSQLLIYWFKWGVVVCGFFSASAASDRPSWSFGPLEIFEETSKAHFIFLVGLLVFYCYWKPCSWQMFIHVIIPCLISNWANVRVTLSVLLPLLRHLNIPVSFGDRIRLRKAKA